MTWKFDNYLHTISPYGHDIAATADIFSRISCPAMLYWGTDSFAPIPADDPRYLAIPDCRLVTVENAGHWLHHDQFDLFVRETTAFLRG